MREWDCLALSVVVVIVLSDGNQRFCKKRESIEKGVQEIERQI